MKTKNIIFLIVLLVILDQVAKLIIYNSFMDVNCEIIPKVLDFKPVFNSKYSWVNDSIHKKSGMDAGLIFHIILFALAWFIIYVIYRYLKKLNLANKIADMSIVLFTAAVSCAYLGILVWEKGILDFLHFEFLGYVCDLKDIYINCFVVLFCISAIKCKLEFKGLANYIIGLFRR